MLLDEWPELPGGETLAAEVGRRDDRRRARSAVDQGDLAEVVAGAKRPDDLAVDADRGVAVLDHEEADPRLALGGDRVALAEAALLHAGDELLQLLRLHSLKERNAADRVHHVSHAAILLTTPG